MKTLIYYVFVTSGLIVSCIQYVNDHVSKACFMMIAVGILLVLNEVRRNARIVTNYYHCEFRSLIPPDISTPLPGPAAPGHEAEVPNDGDASESRR